MVNIKNYLEALDLKEEVRHRGDCPKCKGKNTFTATRDGSAQRYSVDSKGMKSLNQSTSCLLGLSTSSNLLQNISTTKDLLAGGACMVKT
jgi:hypothetical protein